MGEFFLFIDENKGTDISKEMIMDYGRIKRENQLKSINEEARTIRLLANKAPLTNSDTLVLVEHRMKKGHNFVARVINSRL